MSIHHESRKGIYKEYSGVSSPLEYSNFQSLLFASRFEPPVKSSATGDKQRNSSDLGSGFRLGLVSPEPPEYRGRSGGSEPVVEAGWQWHCR